ncbi:hypothetical protein Ct61P_08514 [Colletotrichum tofieldiae]|nr:hypothetical protein Ct61P_08514 [Colletotrichum tofieldiae]
MWMTYTKDHGTVDDTTDRRQTLEASVEQLLNAGLIGDVAGADGDVSTFLSSLIDEHLDLTSGGTATGQENQVSGTMLDHPSGHAATKTTSTTDEEVSGVGLEQSLRSLGRSCHNHVLGMRDDDKLAGTLGSLKRLECRLHAGHGEDSSRVDGPELVVSQELGHISNQPLHDLGPLSGKAEDVDAQERSVVVGLAHVETGGARAVLPADIDEAAEAAETSPTLPQSISARQSVEDDVDTLVVGGASHGSSPGGVAAVEDVVLGDVVMLHQELLLGCSADGDEDLGTDHLSEADRGLANATTGGVNQDALALTKARLLDQAVVSGAVGQRKGGGVLERHLGGHGHDVGSGGASACGIGAVLDGESGNAVASLVGLDSGADSSDDTRSLDSEGMLVGLRDLALGKHDIAEVHANSLDLELNLIIAKRLGSRDIVNKVHRLDGTRCGELHLEAAVVLAKGLELDDAGVGLAVNELVHLLVVNDAGREEPARSLHELKLAGGRSVGAECKLENLKDHGGGLVVVVKVESCERQNGLGPDGSAKTDDHIRLGRGGLVIGATDNPQAALNTGKHIADLGELLLGGVGKEGLLDLSEHDGQLALGVDLVHAAHLGESGGSTGQGNGEAVGQHLLRVGIAVDDRNINVRQRSINLDSRGAVDLGLGLARERLQVANVLPLELVAELARGVAGQLSLAINDGRDGELINLDDQVVVLRGGEHRNLGRAGLGGEVGLAVSLEGAARRLGKGGDVAGDRHSADRRGQVDGVDVGSASAKDGPVHLNDRLQEILDALEGGTVSDAELSEALVNVGLGNSNSLRALAGLHGSLSATKSGQLLLLAVDLVGLSGVEGNQTDAVLSPAAAVRPRADAELLPGLGCAQVGLLVGAQVDGQLNVGVLKGQGLDDRDVSELELLKRNLLALRPLSGRLQSHADESRDGEDRDRLNGVVTQPGKVIQMNNVPPCGLKVAGVDSLKTDQIVSRRLAVLVHLSHARLLPVLVLVVPGVAGKISQQRRLLLQVGEVDVVHVENGTLGDEVAGKVHGRLNSILLADERGDVGNLRRSLSDVLEDLLDGTLKGRVRAQLDDHVDTGLVLANRLQHGLEGLGEADRAGKVVNPVVSLAFEAIDLVAVKRRVEADVGGLRVGEIRNRLSVLLGNEVHVVRVVGSLNLQAPVEHLLLLQVLLELNESVSVAGDGQTGRTVVAGNSDLLLLQRVNHGLDFLLATANSHHGTAKIGVPLLQDGDETASVVGDGHGSLEADDASGVSGTDLTTGVTGNGCRADTPGAEEIGQRKLDGTASRLTDVGVSNSGGLLILAELLDEGPFGAQLLEALIGSVNSGGVNGVCAVKLTTHAPPLGTLASEDEANSQRLALLAGNDLSAVKSLNELERVRGRNGDPPGKQGATRAEGVGDIVHQVVLEDLGSLLEVDNEVLHNSTDRVLVVSGQDVNLLGTLGLLGVRRR